MKALRRRASGDYPRLERAISGLAAAPHPPGSRKLEGSEAIFRLRVGDYRILYEVDEQERLVVIARVVRRTEATYRRA